MDDKVINPDAILDTSGMLCPIPVIKASQSIKQIEVGQVLKMIATDPGAVPDMAAWSRQTGHEMLESHQEDDIYIFFFRRTR
jgi:TusA-related sulfurtransferase